MINYEQFFNNVSNFYEVIQDDRGQWAHPHKITEINSSHITMKGVNYPVLGVSNANEIKLMLPNRDYFYNGDKVLEFPINLK